MAKHKRHNPWPSRIGVFGAVALSAQLLALPGHADDVVLDVASVSLERGDTGVVSITLAASSTGGDVDGCNAGPQNPVTIALVSNKAHVTVTPASVTVYGCTVDDAKTVTVGITDDAPEGAGGGKVTASAPNGTAAVLNGKTGLDKQDRTVYSDYSDDHVIVHLIGDETSNTQPSVSVTGPEDGATYEIGSVPAASCEVTDLEEPDLMATPVLSDTLVHGIGNQTVTCDVTDSGGLVADQASVSYTVEDTGNPTITHTVSPEDPDGLLEWYISAPTVTFDCDDLGGSGISTCVVDGTNSNEIELGEDDVAQTVSGTATDWAGNTATDQVAGLKVDLSDPTVTCPTTAPKFVLGSTSTVTATVSDDESGAASETATGNAVTTGAVGPATVDITGYDKAGRDTTVSCSYSVIYPWSGFFQPIDTSASKGKDSTVSNDTIFNKVKAGSGVPVKFNLGGDRGLNIFSTGYPAVQKVNCSSAALNDPLEETATGATSGLKLDTVTGQYNYTWKTLSSQAGTCVRLQVKFIDGESYYAFFNLTK